MTTIVVNYAAVMPVRPYGGVSAVDRVAGRRARLLDAGLELFGTRGYSATGVKDVCREAGLTDRYFYESFTDRTALFLAVFDGRIEALFGATVAAVADAGADPRAQLRAATGSFLDAIAADPRIPRVIFSEPASVGPEAEQHMRVSLRRFASLVSATARIHLPDETEQRLTLIGLALVGTLERVVVEWQDGELELGSAVADDVTELFMALFTRVGWPSRPSR